MYNIAYSTTRQWNCGDEFILFGVINIFNEILGEHNPIIYNRNPDIRHAHGFVNGFRIKKISNEGRNLARESILRYGFNDNSIKYDSDLSYVNFAVFAGSPEWLTERCINFYEHIIRNGIPSFILGVGAVPETESKINPLMKEVISKSLFFSVRDKKFLEYDFAYKNKAIYLPCPALLSAPLSEERQISNLKEIGLCFSVSEAFTVKIIVFLMVRLNI